MIALVTGGARSGKSKFAEHYAATLGDEGIYIATMERGDEEMKKRIERHIQRRAETDFFRETREVPLYLAEALQRIYIESRSARAQRRVIVVDCLSLWLSNWLLAAEKDDPEAVITAKVDALVNMLTQIRNPVVLVTNEVGDGIVPAYALGRMYRDLAGQMNQALAAVSQRVFLVTAGIPVELKSIAFRLDDLEES